MKKETLLKYDGFVDNEYLDQYLELVNNHVDPQLVYERHHVIPACWYSARFNVKALVARHIADSDPLQETVNLTAEDHYKVHELLTKCTVGSFNEKLLFAYGRMSIYNTTDKIKEKRSKHKKINELAKKLRKESRYTISWEACKKEARNILEADHIL